MSDSPDKSNDAFEPFDLDQRYSDWQTLGQGGMGKVFVAHDANLDKKVAIKLLHSDVDSRAIVRFQQEAKVLSKLSHKFIVRIMDFHYTKSGQLFLVMEHIDGSSLESVLNETGRLSPEEALRIAIQLSQALKHAHAQGIIHRDLKPANVMLDSERNAKILDFGIAKLISSSEIFGTLTKAGQLIGSPLYMSPEQLRGEAASELSDVYGLGLLIFTMISGEPPFAGSNLMESLQQRLTEEAPSLQPYVENQKLCEVLDAIIARALHANPDQRLKTMVEFEVELLTLQAATAPDAIVDTAVNPSVAVKPRQTKRQLVGAFAFVALSLGLAVFAYYTSLGMSEKATKLRKSSLPVAKPVVLPVSVESLRPTENSPSGTLTRIEPIDGFTITGKFFWIPVDTLTEDDLTRLRASSVECLDLANNASITGDMLTKLPNAHLKALILRNTNIKDEDLKSIGEMKKLFWLNLSNTAITDRGIKYLQPLSDLRRLELKDCTGITDHVIPKLLKIKSLRNLHLNNTMVTRDGVIQLSRGLPQLINVGFGGLDVIDQDIIDFPHLKHVDLSGCKKITDRTLKHFAKRKCSVNVEGCPQVTERAIRMFRKTHPLPKPRRIRANDVNAVGDIFSDY